MGRGAPNFDLELGSERLNASQLRHVLSVQLQESIDALDTMTVRLAVPRRAEDVLVLARHLTPFKVRLGYGDETIRQVEGDILEISHSRSADAPWTITLMGMDRLHRLRTRRRSQVWNCSASAVASAIAADHGFVPEVLPLASTPTPIVQSNVDDATFLMKLARDNNYLVRVQHDRLYFAPRSVAYLGEIVLTWGVDLLEVNVKQSLPDIPTEVTVKGWDYAQDKSTAGVARKDVLRRISGGVTAIELVEKVLGKVSLVLDNATESSITAATARATAELQRRAEGFVKGTLTCVGRPEAASGGTVRLAGLGPLDGSYLIEEATHLLEAGGGYHTELAFASDTLPEGI